MADKFEGCGPVLIEALSLNLVGLRKTTKNLSQGTRWHSRDSNSVAHRIRVWSVIAVPTRLILNIISKSIFVMEAQYVFCKVGTEF
jgi:hypothetical protein